MFNLYEIECECWDWGHIAISHISYSLYDSDVKWNIKCQICSAFISVHSSVKIDESCMKEKRNPGKMQFILQHDYQLVSEKKGEKISKNKKSGSCFSFTLNTLTSLKMLSHIVDFFLCSHHFYLPTSLEVTYIHRQQHHVSISLFSFSLRLAAVDWNVPNMETQWQPLCPHLLPTNRKLFC